MTYWQPKDWQQQKRIEDFRKRMVSDKATLTRPWTQWRPPLSPLLPSTLWDVPVPTTSDVVTAPRPGATLPTTGIRAWMRQRQAEYEEKYGGEPGILESYYQRRRQEATGIEKAVISPLFRIGNVGVSASDIVGVAALAYGAYQGVRVLIPLTKEISNRTLQIALNSGLDKWIAKRSRGVPPQHMKTAQDYLYGLIARDKVWLQERATENMLRRQGKVSNAVNDTINDIETILIPRGTQTGAMAFGGKRAPKVPGTPEAGIPQPAGVKEGVTPVTSEVISLETPNHVVREALAKLFGRDVQTVSQTEFWGKLTELQRAKSEAVEGSKVWRSLGQDIGMMRQHIEFAEIAKPITPTTPAAKQTKPEIPVAEPTPIVPQPALPGKFWLPEPPRTPATFMTAKRREMASAFRRKEGVLNTVEEAHQMVMKAKDVGTNAVPFVMSYIRQAGNTIKEFGIDAKGMATKVGNPENRSLAINDVLSNYTHYKLTPSQTEVAKRHGFVYKEALKLAKSYGVEITELPRPDEFWQYIARRVTSKLNPLTGKYETPPPSIGGFKMGAKISAQKQRVFDEMTQGLDMGYLYENPDQVLTHHIQGIYRLIGNKQAEQMVKALTHEITKEQPIAFGERAVNEPALRNRAAAIQIANAIDKIFTPQQETKALRVAAEVSGVMVGQVAAMDISAPFIQGVPLIGHDLKQGLKGKPSTTWLQSYGNMWKAIKNPETINNFRHASPEREDLYKRFIEAGGITGDSEFVSGVGTAIQTLGKIPKVGKTVREIYRQTWGRMGEAYSDFLEVARIKYFEQMLPVWEREGHNPFELAAVTNRMTGTVSSVARGVGANRRYTERIAAFAPNYLRSSLLMLKDLISRGASAREVQESIAAMLGIGAAVYYVEEKMRGREPKIQPWPKRLGGDGADAFTTEIGNTRVGFGSWVYGMMKMLAEVGAVAVDDPVSLLKWNPNHPVVRFLKTKRGAALGLAADLATGTTFYGKRFEDGSDYLERILESAVPIATQSITTQHPRGDIYQVIAEAMGLRAYPSQWDTGQWKSIGPGFGGGGTVIQGKKKVRKKWESVGPGFR